MSEANIKYDPQVDILRIRWTDAPIEESHQVQPGLILDYDESGSIIGLELLDASEHIHKTPLVSAEPATEA